MTKKLLTTAVVLIASLAQAEIMINEIMADNGGSYPNAAGEAMDWLELYNAGATPVDLTGWRITDTVEDEWSKWKEIPEGTTVPAQGYLLLWGHNKDFPTPEDKKGFCGVTNGEVHVKLGLSSKGETITLAASEADYNATNFADQATFGTQFADVSYGRGPDDTAKWLFFTNATPGSANGTDGLEKYPPDEQGGGDEHEEVSGDTELETRVLMAGLPVVIVDTVGGEEPTYEIAEPPAGLGGSSIRNATKIPGRIKIKKHASVLYDSGEYRKGDSGMTIKVRGNTSVNSARKPYKIKLQKKADLLCRGDADKYSDKEWVLLSTSSTLNNTIGFKVNELIGLQWTPKFEYVNLIKNGKYCGVYMLGECENRNVRCRINVADDGYLFELDAYWWNEDVYFKTPFCSKYVGYTFKYPDSDDLTEEHVHSLSNSMVAVEDAIASGTYGDRIDVRSFAKWLLCHDILGTWDLGGSNVYLTKYDDAVDTKVEMANLWDFDTSYRMTNRWAIQHSGSTFYYPQLMSSSNHSFNNAYVREWRMIRGRLCEGIRRALDEMEVSGLADAINASRVLEEAQWPIKRNMFEYDRMITEGWFSNRVEWIDAHIGEMPTDPDIVVTEIMADNGGSYTNADGNASDWIELYNAGATDADISGWRLCDSTTKKWSKWEELPEGTVVPAGGYLIVWADDFTGWTNGEVHVNLGFSSKGEEVALAIAEGEIVDSFAFGPQHTDVSFGRDLSDPEKLVYFRTSTPGAVNGNDGVENGDCFSISINEQMAENGGKFPNAAGEAMDWLELYNAGAADVDVSGWGFQDDPTKAWSKWKTLPEGAVVPAGGYLLVWGDNKDFNSFTGFTNDEVHVNMGLSKKGEGLHLALTNGVGTVVRIDGFEFPKQAPDVSWGRTASDPDKFLYFTEPTPAAANGDAGREALVFTIDFDSNGGSSVASVTNDYGAAISAPEAPARTGYAFAGWYESGAADPFVFSTMPARDVALTARWTANEYTVVYDPNGGEGASVTNGATYDAPFEVGSCGFARTGYAFAGWTTNLDAAAEFAPGAAVSNLTSSANGDVTMYATWEANVYAVSFDSNGGSAVGPLVADYGAAISAPETPARTGYAFAGWYESGAADPFVFSTMPARDVALTARWTANEYTVVYDPNGGEGASVTNGATYDAPFEVGSCGFARTGYAFAGWTTNLDAAAEFAPGAAVSNLTAEAGAMVTLYATWETNAYTLVYAADNGTGASVSTNLTYDAEHVVLTNPFAKAGHSFVSWTNEAGVAYLPGQTVTNLAAEAGATVVWTAAWTANVYAVSFDSNGGSAVDPLVADYGAAISAPEAPVRTGYAFAGWYESDAAEPFVFSTMPARDVALAARWTANEYTVVYDANGGEGAMEPMDFTYDVEKPLASNAYSKVGYTFAGWAREAATGMSPPRLADGEVVSNLTAEAGASVTLYAVWERVGVAAGETKTVVDEVTGEEKTVVVLPETEPEFTGEAAAVYDGFVMSAAGEVVGTVQVKAAKANKKSGISTLTATVQIVGEKKLSFKGGEWGPGSEYAEMALKDGRVLTVAIGANGLVGTFGEYEINGSANIFSSKDKETKAFVKAIEDAWVGAVNVVGDGVVLSVAIAKKGKVKVSGTVDGAKVSATSQLLVGAEVCCIPVVITKKANLAFNLWLNADGSVEIAGLDGAAAGKAGTLKSGATFRMDGAALERALPGLLADYLPDGLAIGLNKTKWIVAPDEKGKAAKAGKVVLNKKTGEIDETKLGANPAALKLTYKAKDGSFKGSFKAYTLDAKGKIKSYTVNVTGVMVGNVGYGTATLKKPSVSVPISVE